MAIKMNSKGEAVPHGVYSMSIPEDLMEVVKVFQNMDGREMARSVFFRRAVEFFLVAHGQELPRGYETKLDPRLLVEVRKTVKKFNTR